jgi:hypothetical protein
MKSHHKIILLAAVLVVGIIAAAAASLGPKQEPNHANAPEATQPASQPGAAPPTTATATATSAASAPPADNTATPPIPATPPSASSASPEQIAELSKPSGGPNGGLYTVQDGTKVDPHTLAGWKTWRALACDRCHGNEQQGLVGPALVVSLHRLTKDEFKTTITNGRIEKGMPPFSTSAMVMENWENLYAYLKGRADAQIKPGHLYPIEEQQAQQ